MSAAPPEHAPPAARRPRPWLRVVTCVVVAAIIILGFLSSKTANHDSTKNADAPDGTVRVNAGPRMILGTFVRISVVAPADRKTDADKAIEAAFARVQEIDDRMSIFNPKSELSQLNDGGSQIVSEDTFAVVKKAQEVSALTGGAFDVTVQPLIRLWKAAAKKGSLPTEAELKEALALVAFQSISLNEAKREITIKKKGASIDLAGIAKGYAVDVASQSLRSQGFTDTMVEAGGEVYCSGNKAPGAPWRIGVQDPRSEAMEPRLVDVILGLTNVAVATSGDYQQFVTIDGQRFSHIVDPRTGQPADDVPGATIIAPDCMTADALATAVSVMGVEKGLALIDSLADVEALLILVKDGQLEFHKSKGFDKFVLGTGRR